MALVLAGRAAHVFGYIDTEDGQHKTVKVRRGQSLAELNLPDETIEQLKSMKTTFKRKIVPVFVEMDDPAQPAGERQNHKDRLAANEAAKKAKAKAEAEEAAKAVEAEKAAKAEAKKADEDAKADKPAAESKPKAAKKSPARSKSKSKKKSSKSKKKS